MGRDLGSGQWDLGGGSISRQPRPNFVRCYAGNPKRRGAPAVTAKPASDKPPDNPREDKGYTVNYFEKDATGEVRRMSSGDPEDDEDVDIEDIKALEASALAKLDKLDATLESLSQKSNFLEKLLARHGPPGAVEALREALDSYGDLGDVQDKSHKIHVPLIAEDSSEVRIKRADLDKINNLLALLNNWVKRSHIALRERKLNHQHISKTWAYFLQFRRVLLKTPILVPEGAWDAMWAIFSFEGPENPSRYSQIRDLYNVMTKAGAPLSDKQHLLAIEATYVEGYESVAISQWKRFAPVLGEKDSCAIAFWELGVRLWSQQGDIERAERASRALLDRASPETPADTRVLLHLIRAYASRADTAEKGFLLYRRMRDLANDLEKPLEIEDYDDAISVFLTTGHTDYAMFIFTDMMFAGAVNLYGRTKLPSSVKNRFFFGKWLKRLIGARDLDGAYQVLVYMQKNGVMAAAVQVNGLIGAYLRSRTAENRKKAVRLAWSMINARKAFVDLRRRERTAEWPIRLYDGRPNSSEHEGEGLDYTMVPRATAETFILMAENYRERGLFGQLEELFVAYKEGEIGGDALMMNELIAAAVAQGRGDKAQEIYHMMVHDHDILPNTDTHAILFKALPVNSLPKGRQLEQVPAAAVAQSRSRARGLFADMMASNWAYREDGWRERHGGLLSEEQVKLVLHTFRKCGDYEGVVVALECLRDVLRFRITRNVLLEMIAEVEGIDRPTPRTHRIVVRTTMKLQSLVEQMQRRHQAEAEAEGKDGAKGEAPKTNPDKVKDSQFLYSILLEDYLEKARKQHKEAWHFNKAFKEAREEMGAPASIPADLKK
ncbi:hypothetical protein SLS53_002798 [Cytospora paraplurivora]|uniref:Pentatricopeptide repeat-containing protein n=1 Tax=Cytospora paraplurivora TaxID=2898453 RepID=A0AAN9UEN7_9PEZI